MLTLALLMLTLAAVVGHVTLWLFCINRVQGMGLPRPPLWILTWTGHFSSILIPSLLVVSDLLQPDGFLRTGNWEYLPLSLRIYGGICLAVTLGPVPYAAWKWRHRSKPAVLKDLGSRTIDVREMHGPAALGKSRWSNFVLTRPFNETLSIEVTQKELAIAGLPASLSGRTIAHLSDLHFTGKIGLKFFEQAAAEVRDLDADLVAVTGDLVDSNKCLDWLPAVMGGLASRHGTFLVLGNHDLRVSQAGLQTALANSPITHIGGKSIVLEVDGHRVLLAGNELPWYLPDGQIVDAEHLQDSFDLRILLSHSPDQIGFAQRHKFDLMLAGHTHGGQIQIPGLGPIVSPSLFGVKYASGTFYEDPVVMHVSRGLSGKTPLRINCPPEITLLTLVPAPTSEPATREHKRRLAVSP